MRCAIFIAIACVAMSASSSEEVSVQVKEVTPLSPKVSTGQEFVEAFTPVKADSLEVLMESDLAARGPYWKWADKYKTKADGKYRLRQQFNDGEVVKNDWALIGKAGTTGKKIKDLNAPATNGRKLLGNNNEKRNKARARAAHRARVARAAYYRRIRHERYLKSHRERKGKAAKERWRKARIARARRARRAHLARLARARALRARLARARALRARLARARRARLIRARRARRVRHERYLKRLRKAHKARKARAAKARWRRARIARRARARRARLVRARLAARLARLARMRKARSKRRGGCRLKCYKGYGRNSCAYLC